MNIRDLRAHVLSTVLATSVVGGFAGLGTHPVLAQSITVTTAFPFCVNNQAYPKGRYQFTHVSRWFLSIRDVNGGRESLFLVRPQDHDPHGLATGGVRSAPGVTFHVFDDFTELQAFDDLDSGLTFELIRHRISRDKLMNHGSLEPANCFNQKVSIPSRNTTSR